MVQFYSAILTIFVLSYLLNCSPLTSPPPHHADNPVGHPPQAQAWLDAEEEDIQEAPQNMEEEVQLPQEPPEHVQCEGGNSGRGGG